MRSLTGLVLGAVLAAVLASPAAAQHRFFSMARPGMPVRASFARAPRAIVPARIVTPQAGPSSPVKLAGTVVATTSATTGLTATPILTPAITGFAPLSVSQLLNPVPGLGFDFSHLAAVNENLDIRALIDPVTQQRLALAERLLRETPVFPAVFPAFAPSPVVVVQSPLPIVVVQQPAVAQVAAAPPAGPVAAAAAPAAPIPVPALILVRKDGSRVRAVAFAQQGKQILYITPEGERRSLPLADLDVDATVRVNEARGTFLRFSLLP